MPRRARMSSRPPYRWTVVDECHLRGGMRPRGDTRPAAAARTYSSMRAVDFQWCQTGLEVMPQWCHTGAIMELTSYVETLRRDLAVAAGAGGEDARALAERL